MKFVLSFVLAVACSINSMAIEIPVNWKVGDKKTFNITSTSYEGEPGNLVEEDTEMSAIAISVVKDHGDQLEIEIDGVGNELTELVETIQEKLSEKGDFGEVPDIDVQLVIDKETGEFDIRNWEEVSAEVAKLQVFFALLEAKMNANIDESDEEEDETKEFARAFGGMFLGIFKTMSDIISTKDGMIGMYVGDLAYITIPFGVDFEVGETVSQTESFTNSIGVMAEMSAEVDRTLVSTNSNNATISCQMAFDEDAFIAAFKKMMLTMFAGFLGEEEAEAKVAETIDGMKASLNTDMTVEVDTKTGWISKATMKSIIIMTSPDGEVDYTENITEVVVE